MSWFRLDDNGAFHRKVLLAGNEAYGAWCRMGQHSSAQLADGFIDAQAALLIAGRKAVIARLLLAVLLEQVEGGYQIHDFLDYNPSSEQVRSTREARSNAGKRGGSRSASTRAKQTTARAEANTQAIASAPAQANDEAIASAAADPVASTTPKQNPTPSRPVPSPTQASSSPNPSGSPPETKPLVLTPDPEPPPRPAPVLDLIDRFQVNGLDALEQLRGQSENKIRATGGAVQATKFGDHLALLQRQHRRGDLVELLAAFAKAGAFAWMQHRLPSTDWFLEDDGKQLTRSLEEAIEWDRNGRNPIPKREREPKRKSGIAPPAPPSEYAEATRLGRAVPASIDEINAALARRRANGG